MNKSLNWLFGIMSVLSFLPVSIGSAQNISKTDAKSKCPEAFIHKSGSAKASALYECRADLLNNIGEIGDEKLLWGKYTHMFWDGKDQELVGMYGFIGELIVVYRTTSDAQLEKIWEKWTPDYTDGSAEEISLIENKFGHFLTIEYTRFGTGGGWKDFFRVEKSKLKEVKIDIESGIKNCFPLGYSLHKGIEIDLGKLTAGASLAGPNDPNCCGSRWADMKLHFSNETVSVKSCKSKAVPKTK